jgi:4-carboxymuconolactone decarboxylase
MVPDDLARTRRDEFFPGQLAALALTDPELVETFERFALNEVLGHGGLDTPTRLIVQLAVLVALPALREYRAMLGVALDAGVTPVQAKEVVYQAALYVGMPSALDFIHDTNDVLTERGVALPLPGQSTTTPADRADTGLALERQIFGRETVDDFFASAPADQLHIQQHVAAHAFGDNLSRSGLDARTRELISLTMLVAMGGCEPQVKLHVAANLRVGNDRARLIDVLTQLLPYIGYPRMLNALRALNEALET